jgi:2-polyprenyl-3-methyl-5-hydroxy-6-metoxy-1,4-benzoquinol methylase
VSNSPPKELIHIETPIRCRICAADAGGQFTANGFAWFRCRNCRTTQKILTHQQYLNLNPTYDPGVYLDGRNRDEVEAFLNVNEATKVLTDAIETSPRKGTAHNSQPAFLDVGCGMGRYLIAAQRLGFEVLGIEPSVEHARIAIDYFQLPVIRDYFSVDRIGARRFDLIMLSHVIEHIYDPKSFLLELISVLKPGGALVVITPNNDSLVARTTGKAWPMLKPVDHVSLIGVGAYAHFDLGEIVDVHHSTTEYPFEFAAAALAALKSSLLKARRDRSANLISNTGFSPSPLRAFNVGARMLRGSLTAISAPMYGAAIVMRRQACLRSVLVRKA